MRFASEAFIFPVLQALTRSRAVIHVQDRHGKGSVCHNAASGIGVGVLQQASIRFRLFRWIALLTRRNRLSDPASNGGHPMPAHAFCGCMGASRLSLPTAVRHVDLDRYLDSPSIDWSSSEELLT